MKRVHLATGKAKQVALSPLEKKLLSKYARETVTFPIRGLDRILWSEFRAICFRNDISANVKIIELVEGFVKHYKRQERGELL